MSHKVDATWHRFRQNPSKGDKKPDWIKKQVFKGTQASKIELDLRSKTLWTVCEEAKCPNRTECWSEGTATIMVMGKICTRGCRFCSVQTGKPLPLDPQEPFSITEMIQHHQWDYVVLTMVDRDDLEDGGIQHLIRILQTIYQHIPQVELEILTGDFQGRVDPLIHFLQTSEHNVKVFAHNIETVERLTPRVRDRRASFVQSLQVLQRVKSAVPQLLTKSSLMLGLGETEDEVLDAFKRLKESSVDLITLGQYLQPTPQHLPVKSYLTESQFTYYAQQAFSLGFLNVLSGPFVRSSYRAKTFYEQACKNSHTFQGRII